MIAGCPTCAARYRIDTAKLRPEGARLRCSRCETVFRVSPPPNAAPAPAVAAAPAVRAVAPAAPLRSSPPPAPQPPAPPDPARRVVIAHPDVEAGKTVADALSRWGLSVVLVHDGVEALLQIQRTLPRVVVLDAALPKMFGFQVCEIMKRNEQLRSIPVVLVGAIHDQDRYRRPPGELYGADAYVERHQLPDALAEHLARFGMRPQPTPVALPPPPPRAAAIAPTMPKPVAAPVAPPRAAAAATSPEAEKAQRLARIIVSDVVLYNAQKFEAAVRAGNVLEALSAELEEGVSLFAQRVDPRVCDPREYLQRELVRVARSRGMK